METPVDYNAPSQLPHKKDLLKSVTQLLSKYR